MMTPEQFNASFTAPPDVDLCPGCKDRQVAVVDGQVLTLCLLCASHLVSMADQSPRSMNILKAAQDAAHHEGQRVAMDHTAAMAARDLEEQARLFEARVAQEREMRMRAQLDADYYRVANRGLRGDVAQERDREATPGVMAGLALAAGVAIGFMIGRWSR